MKGVVEDLRRAHDVETRGKKSRTLDRPSFEKEGNV